MDSANGTDNDMQVVGTGERGKQTDDATCTMENKNGERVAESHLFATGERAVDGFFVQSIRIQRGGEGGREGRGRGRDRECGVLKSPREESVISQAKCEWLTPLREGAGVDPEVREG